MFINRPQSLLLILSISLIGLCSTNAEDTLVITATPELTTYEGSATALVTLAARISPSMEEIPGDWYVTWTINGIAEPGGKDKQTTTFTPGSSGLISVSLVAYDKQQTEYQANKQYEVVDVQFQEPMPADIPNVDEQGSYTGAYSALGSPPGGDYLWSKVSGPGTVTIEPDVSANPVANYSLEGTYEIKVKYTYSEGQGITSTTSSPRSSARNGSALSGGSSTQTFIVLGGFKAQEAAGVDEKAKKSKEKKSDPINVGDGGDGSGGGTGPGDSNVLTVDIIGYQQGTIANPGPQVPDDGDEDNSYRLVLFKNNDNDDGGPGFSYEDYDDTTIGQSDDDIVKLTIKAPGPRVGTVTLNVNPSSAVRVFKGSGSAVLQMNSSGNSSVDLAAPSGDLSNLASGTDIDLYVEGLVITQNVTFTVTYTDQANNSNSDSVRLMVVSFKMFEVTSGPEHLPINPAYVANAYHEGNFENEQDVNRFRLMATHLPPQVGWDTFKQNVDVNYGYEINQGSIEEPVALAVHDDRKGASFVFGSQPGSDEITGSGRIFLKLNNHKYGVGANFNTGHILTKCVKLHLCRRFVYIESMPLESTWEGPFRTEQEVRDLLSDVNKILSQVGIRLTIGNIVTTDVTYEQFNPDSTTRLYSLFNVAEDESAIDIYFVNKINGGSDRAVTISPKKSGVLFESGCAISDKYGATTTSNTNLEEGEFVRVVAHEVMHYLLNHKADEIDDHLNPAEAQSSLNLMNVAVNSTSRELSIAQGAEARTNNEDD